jgi:hypothetical protein
VVSFSRLNVTLKRGQIAATRTGYAYETIPNKPIITGKTKGPDVITLDPATLGHLAVGASQIPTWRGERNRAGALDDSRRKAGQGSRTVPLMRRHKWPDETDTYIPSVERWSW